MSFIQLIKILLIFSLIFLVVLIDTERNFLEKQIRVANAQISKLYPDYDTGILYIRGTIIPNMFNKIVEIDFDKLHTVDLHSVGGDYKTSIILSSLIHSYKLNTYVDTENFCFSGCTIIYQAGIIRTAHYTSLFMYHYPRLEIDLTNYFQTNIEITYLLGQQMFALMERYGLSIEFKDQVKMGEDFNITAENSMKYNIVQHLEIEPWSFEWLVYQTSQIY